MQRFSDTLWLGQLSRNVWIHTTTHVLDGVGYYPANGALVIVGDRTVLIDTGWHDADANAILAAWGRLRKPPVSLALVTHFHSDRVGGSRALMDRGIPVFGNPRTRPLARKLGYPAPRPLHGIEGRAQRLGPLEVFFPGEGHTVDNIVAWIPSERVLLGGCLVKATSASDLGNLADANVDAYPRTLRRLAATYEPRHTIPRHGTIAGNSILHTTKLADAGQPQVR